MSGTAYGQPGGSMSPSTHSRSSACSAGSLSTSAKTSATKVRAKQSVTDGGAALLLVVFYIFVAQSTYAKGLLGFALPGFIILVYLIWSRAWKLLRALKFCEGILIFIVVGLHPGICDVRPTWQRLLPTLHYS